MSTKMYNILEWKGYTYQKGDPIAFKTMKGKFRFQSWEENLDTGTSWVNVWQENKCWRAFRLEEIKKPKQQKPKRKRGVSAAKGLCPDHKTYTGVYKPRTECKMCWGIYNMNHG